MDVFKDYAYYYNMFYRNKSYEKEAKQIDHLLKIYGVNIKKLINYGCGTGRHDIELTKLGYSCAGIDISPFMIDIARNQAKTARMDIDFSVKDIRDFTPSEKYDGVISLFHVMSYQNSNEDILLSFRSARRNLDVGGIFLFDVWYGPGVLSDKPTIRVKELEDEKNKLIRIATPVMHDKLNVVNVQYEVLIVNKKSGNIREIYETHKMRYFFRPELELLLNEAGFEILDNLDCKTLGETNFDTWTSYFIAKAI